MYRVMRILIALFTFFILSSTAQAQTFSGECLEQWSIGGGGVTLRNGVHVGGGIGSTYRCVGGNRVFVFGGDSNWWEWTSVWNNRGATDPGGVPQPWTGVVQPPPISTVPIYSTDLNVAWDSSDPLADAQSHQYYLAFDTVDMPPLSALTPITATCTNANPIVCQAPLPAIQSLAPGDHRLSIAARNTNGSSLSTNSVLVRIGSTTPTSLVPPSAIRVQ